MPSPSSARSGPTSRRTDTRWRRHAGGRTFRALRHRNARIFFAGLLVSNVGTWLQLTAMSLLVYDLTGKATDLGITVALQFLPMLLLGAWAGAVADRRDKRTHGDRHPVGARRAGDRARRCSTSPGCVNVPVSGR